MAEIKMEKVAEPEGQKKALPAIKGKAEVKTTFKSKLASAIIAEEARDVKDYIIYDVLVPAIKKTLRDLVMNTIDLTFFGSANAYPDYDRDRRSPYTSYNAYSRSRRDLDRDRSRSDPDRRNRRDDSIDIRHLDRVEFTYKEDAQDALEFLLDNINEYGYTTVGDYLSVARLPTTSIHTKWGWYDLAGAEPVYSTSGKWFLRLPKPRPID